MAARHQVELSQYVCTLVNQYNLNGLYVKSRVSREVHARFCERLELKCACLLDPENVSTHPKRPKRPTTNEHKTKDKMPTPRKIKRAVSPRPSQHKTAHLILPNAPKPTSHPNIVQNFFGLFLSIKLLSLYLDNI